MTSRRDVTSFVLWYRDVVAALLKWQEINIPPTWNTGPTSHYVGMMLTLHNVNTPTFLSMVNTAVIAIPVLHCCTDQIKVIMRWDSVSQWWQFVYTSPDEFNWPITRHRNPLKGIWPRKRIWTEKSSARVQHWIGTSRGLFPGGNPLKYNNTNLRPTKDLDWM